MNYLDKQENSQNNLFQKVDRLLYISVCEIKERKYTNTIIYLGGPHLGVLKWLLLALH